MDLLLDKDTHDLVFINGGCPVTHSDYDTIGQRLKIRLLTFQGEYQFDTTYGVPYFQQILGKKVRKQDVDNIFKQIIYQEEGVVEIVDFSSTLINFVYNLNFKVVDDKRRLSDNINLNITI